jgi:PAS domain S-box-containing protein
MDAVITVDENQVITLFNPAAEQMFGIRADQALGRSLERLLPERFRATHTSHIQKFTQANVSRRKMGVLIPIYGLRSNGEEFPIEASISQAHVGGQVILSVILRDVSERNRSEETLRQHASLLDVAPVLVRDMDDRIVFWSSGLAKLYKFKREEAEGHISHELLQTKFPEPLEEILKKLHSLGFWEGELLHRDREGNQVVVNSQWVLNRDSQGAPIRILELNADITAKKRAEAIQLRSQKLESLGTLAAGISHDFNNILLAITGNTGLAIADLPADHPVQESLAEIAKAGSRATDLVRRILTFSRPDELKRQTVDLRPVMEEALKLVRATLPATIQFQTEFAADLPTVLADSSQVHQIIVNLATNASHAIGAKSDGLIQIRLDATDLNDEDYSHALDLPSGNYVRLSISDNGCGMDAATLERIYDPFFTTKKPGEGTGLGLSVVHGIMKNHGGGIVVYSDPGRGTAFRLFFPAAGAALAAATKPSSMLLRLRNESILYVDDEEPLVVLAKRTLERLGYKVTGQTNPLQALELFRRDPTAFDAVVTDLAMPQLSGFDLAAQILALRPNVPIIMNSGFVRPEDQERALHMGLRDLILKPDTIDQLGRILDHVFQADPIVPAKPLA